MNESTQQMTAGTPLEAPGVQTTTADATRGDCGLDTGARGWRWMPPRGTRQMQAGERGLQVTQAPK